MANNSELKDFQIDVNKDTATRQYLITVKQKGKSALLGFVSFEWDKSDNGTVKIANFNARLHEKNFSLGSTTKKWSKSKQGSTAKGSNLRSLRCSKSFKVTAYAVLP